jgi:hypothetical protein
MGDEYRHDGGSNRAGDGRGNLIGWFVYTDDEGKNLELVDRQGERLTVEKTADGIVVRSESGEERVPRPATLDDPFYMGVSSDGHVRVYVDGRGKLLVPIEELRGAAGWDVGDRPGRVEFVCGDCGRALNPVEALELRLANSVMKVCPSCFAIREELDGLLG